MADKQWTMLFPVQGLLLTKQVNNSLIIDDVTFIARKRLLQKCDDLGIKKESFLKNSKPDVFDGVLKNTETYAVFRRRNTLDQARREAFEKVQEALSILCASQLGYKGRRSNARLELSSRPSREFVEYVAFDKNDKSPRVGATVRSPYMSMTLDKDWIGYNKANFFIKLLKKINDKDSNEGWRKILKRVLIYTGESQREKLPFKALT